MLGFITAYADEAANAAAGTPQEGGVAGLLISFLPMILIFVLLYWMMIRPQKKQQKQQQAMRAALKVGDKVVTIGGICGKVAKIKDDFVYIESSMPGAPDEKSYIKFKKNAIESVEKQIEE
ncbi:MAG: preprotein translocase subunit YajC [Clostridia bacterium]|nr:preprotein translocase subunit YajC [Clostridia bacterium]